MCIQPHPWNRDIFAKCVCHFIWAFTFPFVCRLKAARCLGFPFQQEYVGSAEKIDMDNQCKGKIEKNNSDRDLVDEYERNVENHGWVEDDR